LGCPGDAVICADPAGPDIVAEMTMGGPPVIIANEQQVTEAVLAVMGRTPDPRLREIMTALVQHLHAFIRQVKLTEREFQEAVAIINSFGQQTTVSHNEAVMMAGSLGVSTLVCLLNNGARSQTETSANLLGPFWRMHSPRVENGGSLIRSETPGPALYVDAVVQDTEGRPVAGAEVDVWHSSPVGLYENQDPEQAEMNLRGKFTTDIDGRFWFWSVKPAGYPIPIDGTVGRLLKAQGRRHYRPAHLHALIYKEGFKTIPAQVYVDDDPDIANDPQFGVTRHLLARYVRHDGPAPKPGVMSPWYRLDYTFTIEPGEARLPRPPIK